MSRPPFEPQLIYNLMNAQVRDYPFPHLYVQDVFPADFYQEIMRNLPDIEVEDLPEKAMPLKGYKERFFFQTSGPLESLPEDQRTFWNTFDAGLTSGTFLKALLSKFAGPIRKRFQDQPTKLSQELTLIQDLTKYALGPHTDHPSKVLTALFYLPSDERYAHMGTSLYTPDDPTRVCPGGPHHGYEGFSRAATMPFVPNSMLAFVKSDTSFHGVEPVTDPNVRRWLLGYAIKTA